MTAGGPFADSPDSDRQGKKAPSEAQKLGSHQLIVEVGDEGVHDCATDGGNEHGGPDAGLRRRVVSDQDVTQAVHNVTKCAVISEEPNDHWIAENGAGGTPAGDGEVHDAGDE